MTKNKKLEILVPQWKEDDKVVKFLLDSIEMQQGVDLKNDIGVIIVNDGSDVFLSEKVLHKYTFDVLYVKAEHGGVSATRNKALDLATADYVMFCDADDGFYNVAGLHIILEEIEKSHFDTMSSAFIEEQHLPNGEVKFLRHGQDAIFVHGKVHRRQYLIDQNIRWNDKLLVHEDSYFNCLCQQLTDKAFHTETEFYLWKYRENSICREDKDFKIKTYQYFIDSNESLIKEFLARGKKDKAQFHICNLVFGTYYTLNEEQWLLPENKQYRDAVECRFALFYKQFKEMFDATELETKAKSLKFAKDRSFNEGLLLESELFDDWEKRIIALGVRVWQLLTTQNK